MPPRARLYKTEAIILRWRKLGEADRILTLFTPAFGKMEAKAKGVRKTTSRLSGHLQPLNRCQLQLARDTSQTSSPAVRRSPASAASATTSTSSAAPFTSPN